MDTRHFVGSPGIAGGSFGFSRKPFTSPSAATSTMPKSEPCSMGTGMTATVQSAFFSRWKSSIWRTSIW